MRKLSLFLILGLQPLTAQTSLNDSARIAPPAPPESAAVNAAPDVTSAAIAPNTARPAAPIMQPKLDRFTVSPGTVREGLTYKNGVNTVLRLTAPTLEPFTCKVISSDPEKLSSGNIFFQKNDIEQKGALGINWKKIPADCQVTIKVYDPHHPETVLHARVYLRKGVAPVPSDTE
jgi:hypothetical protein